MIASLAPGEAWAQRIAPEARGVGNAFPGTAQPEVESFRPGLSRAAALSSPAPASPGRLVAGGLIGAGAGTALGFALGPALFALDCEPPECGRWVQSGVLQGVSIFTTVLTPLGVHLANDRRGNYWWDLLASYAGFGAATAAMLVVGEPGVVALIPAQLAASYLVERRTSR